MKKIFILLLIGLSMSYISSYGQKIRGKKMIRVSEIETNNHTTNSLQRFISDPENEGASVVVRDPNINRDGVSINPINTRVCALIERGLMEKKFNPRDRRLFENAVAKLEDGSDYPAIHRVTGTDLIFEITQFNAVEFPVSEFYNSDNSSSTYPFQIKKDKKTIISPTFALIGFSIEIKVILLSDNLIAGIYKYNKIPCMDGCEVTLFDENNLRYIDPDTRKTVVAKESSLQDRISFDRYDKEISDFISDMVIPSMFAEMKGQDKVVLNTVANENKIMNEFDEKITELTKKTKNTKKTKEELQKEVKEKELLKQKEITKKNIENEIRDKEIALSSPNSFVISNSVSDLILQTITNENKKHTQYKTDKERFDNLKDKEQIMSYISSITTNVASFPNENNDTAVFFCERTAGNEMVLLLFLDGNCIGIGTKNKGLLTKIPSSQFNGIRTLSLWNKDKELLNTPVDFSFKTYYQFKWERNNIALADKVSDNASVVSSSNSYEISNSISELINQTISQEAKKQEQYKNDEERFSRIKEKKQIIDYITAVTSNVTGSPQEDNETVVFFCEGAKGNDFALLLFMDGNCIGIGTKNKGLLTQIPKTTGIHNLSLWSNDKEVLKTPVNFSFKTYYPFEWERNDIKLKN